MLCSFAVFLNQLPNLHEPHPASVILKAIQDTISTIGRHQKAAGITTTSLMNFVVSDGNTLVATRYVSGAPGTNPATLYFAEGGSYQRIAQNNLSHLSTSTKLWKKSVNALQVAKFTSSLLRTDSANADDHIANCISTGTPNALVNEGDFGLEYDARGPTVCLIASEPVTSGAADWSEVPRNTAIVVQRDQDGVLSIMHAPLSSDCDMDNEAVLVSLQAAADLAVDSHSTANGGIAPLQSSNHQAESGAVAIKKEIPLDDSLENRQKLVGHAHGVVTTQVAGEYLFSGSSDGCIKVGNKSR